MKLKWIVIWRYWQPYICFTNPVNIRRFFFFSLRQFLPMQRSVVFLMTVIFSPFLNKVWVTRTMNGDQFMVVNTFGVNRSQFKWKLELSRTSEQQETDFCIREIQAGLQQNEQNRERRVDWNVAKFSFVPRPPPRQNEVLCNKNVWL